jgi:hypothetical protein
LEDEQDDGSDTPKSANKRECFEVYKIEEEGHDRQ